MRSIVRRDTGEEYEEFLRRLAQESGIATPTREQLAKLDRQRVKKGSNEDWVNPHDPQAPYRLNIVAKWDERLVFRQAVGFVVRALDNCSQFAEAASKRLFCQLSRS